MRVFFYIYTAGHFQESKSGVGILFIKIQVGIVHCVARAHQLCYKAALRWPIEYAIKNCTYLLESFGVFVCKMRSSPSTARRFQESEGSAGIFSSRYTS